jgi:hypothetical protein
MLLINAYCLSFFPSLFPLFPPLHIALHISNKCILPILLSRHFSRPSRAFFRQFYAAFKPSLQASNRCILGIFLSATFSPSRTFSALFPSIFPSYLKLACLLLINAYCPSFFRHFPRPSHAFSALFSVAFYSLFPSIFISHLNLTLQKNVSNKCILTTFLSVTFLALLALFPPFFRRF